MVNIFSSVNKCLVECAPGGMWMLIASTLSKLYIDVVICSNVLIFACYWYKYASLREHSRNRLCWGHKFYLGPL